MILAAAYLLGYVLSNREIAATRKASTLQIHITLLEKEEKS